MRGVSEVEQGGCCNSPTIRDSTDLSLTHSLTHSFVLRVHEPTHEPSAIAVPAQHLALATTQPARTARLETPVEMVFRVHTYSVTLRARHRAVAVTALAQNAARLLRRRWSGGTRITTRSTRTRRIRPHRSKTSTRRRRSRGGGESSEGDLARVELLLHAEALERRQLAGCLGVERRSDLRCHGDRGEFEVRRVQWGCTTQ